MCSVEGKRIPTELKKDEAELKNDVLYDDVERDGKLYIMYRWSAVMMLYGLAFNCLTQQWHA